MSNQTTRKPFFYDVTLRDGNQALRKPWNLLEKEIIFKQLVKLGVNAIEVGFASASESDFNACEHLAKIAPENTVISSLSRAKNHEIDLSWAAIRHANQPRIHIVYPVSSFAIQNMLKISNEEVIQNVTKAVSYARTLAGTKGSVQFSGEHFGDCIDTVEFAIEVFKSAVKAGADVINLANTVERYRPMIFIQMIEEVVKELKDKAIISVHTHNDLGMATATTVESFFTGVTQIETSLNGLGERAGNTNLFEVACALYNCGESIDLNLNEIYPTAQLVAKMSGIPIHEKAPLIGSDVFSHRSGIHQDGVNKTKHLKKSAYGAIDPTLIGRTDGHRITFTSQSGGGAIKSILSANGIHFSDEDISSLQPILKKHSDEIGRELVEEEVVQFAKKIQKIVA
ncbi:MAG TPA: LeuA family protein [Leptospiraceae bacterium]|nr:LeuA family protein [Leptospiraceae bacterium]HMW06064.1 LeuA family protein [Leptospiraceae bacterium]HMX33352.1 LeuA family protein [Leptospiraceae bacterium]HMY31394.1 LeuA family protein [Leptospiraceae bacterium]HMZ64986.1 LeuA family protein [Leptospiraceae bacterium]